MVPLRGCGRAHDLAPAILDLEDSGSEVVPAVLDLGNTWNDLEITWNEVEDSGNEVEITWNEVEDGENDIEDGGNDSETSGNESGTNRHDTGNKWNDAGTNGNETVRRFNPQNNKRIQTLLYPINYVTFPPQGGRSRPLPLLARCQMLYFLPALFRMTRPQTIATNYVAYADQDFIDLGENILSGVTGSKDYPAPPQPLTELANVLGQLAEAVKAMKTGLKAATRQRDYLRPQVDVAFKALSAYAAGATPARPDLWAAANFPLTKAETSPRQTSLPISGLALADGPSPRTLTASVDAQPGMYAYAWRIFPKDTLAEDMAAGYCYRFCLTREPRALLDILDSSAAYGVECAAWNNTGPLQWSTAVFRIVQ